MKKLFFIAAVTAVALSSCSKNEIVTTVDSQNTIGFSTYAANATKATAMTLTGLQTSGFLVSSAKDSSTDSTHTPMASVKVVWDTSLNSEAGGWKTVDSDGNDVAYYWPSDGTVDFVAVNYISDRALGEFKFYEGSFDASTLIDDYELATTAANQEDLVLAYSHANTASTSGTGVPLTFVHALSKVGVKINANTTNTNVEFRLTSITLTAYHKQDLGVSCASGENSYVVAWADGSTTVDLIYTIDTDSEQSYKTFAGNASPTAASAIASGNELMVIPGAMKSITVNGAWYTGETLLDSVTDSVIDLSGTTAVYNTQYSINLTITPKLPITFTVTEDPAWTESAVDKNYTDGTLAE